MTQKVNRKLVSEKASDANATGEEFGMAAVTPPTSTKPYEKPVLIAYGDVRDITLGPTLGTTESGCAAIFRPGPGPGPGGCPV